MERFPYYQEIWSPGPGFDMALSLSRVLGKIPDAQAIPVYEVIKRVNCRSYRLRLEELCYYVKESNSKVFAVGDRVCIDMIDKYRKNANFVKRFKRFFSPWDASYRDSRLGKADEAFVMGFAQYKFFAVENSIKYLDLLKQILSEMISYPLSMFGFREISTFELLDSDAINKEWLYVSMLCVPGRNDYEAHGNSEDFVHAAEQIVMLGHALGLWNVSFKEEKLWIVT